MLFACVSGVHTHDASVLCTRVVCVVHLNYW